MSTVLDAAQWKEVRRLFDLLAPIAADDWPSELEALCDDPAVRDETATLLAARSLPETAIESRFTELVRLAQDEEFQAGGVLGPWLLKDKLGSGGMGSVFRAERIDGMYERTVAIKLLHGVPGGDQVERMKSERQILAGLGLRNVARLYDGGITPRGHPYIVMEFVNGEHFDDHCRRHGLPLPRRVELFLKVCDVVQRAHEKLVVHCDLKPENILISEDGEPTLLDFGIARMLNEARAARAGRVFTPKYAAPELVEHQAISVAIDVFSLGVILLELLADRDVDRGLGVMMQALPSASSWSRKSDRWKRALRGDLDAIVARACAIDPRTRYASVTELSQDLRRWMDFWPVAARNGGRAYTASRWLRRQWQEVAVAALFVALTSVFVYNVVDARRQAEVERRAAQDVSQYLVAMFAATDPRQRGENAEMPLTARELLDRASTSVDATLASDPLQRARMQAALGQAYQNLGVATRAELLLGSALAVLQRQRPRPVQELARLYAALSREQTVQGDGVAAATTAQRGLQTLGNTQEPVLRAHLLHAKGLAETNLQSFPAAHRSFDDANAILAKLPRGHESALRIDVARDMGLLYWRWGRLAESEAQYRRALAHVSPSDRSAVHELETTLARVLRERGRMDESRRLLEDGLARAQALYGPDSRFVLRQHEALADLYLVMGDYRAAGAQFRTLLLKVVATEGEDSVAHSMALHNHAELLAARGDLAAAEQGYRRALRIRQARLGGDTPTALRAEVGLARFLINHGALADARRHLQHAGAGLAARLPPDAPARVEVAMAEVRLLIRDGQLDRARERLDALAGGVEDVRMRLGLRELAAVLAEAEGQTARAVAIRRQGIIAIQQLSSSNNAELARWRLELAKLEQARGNEAGAASLLEQALPVLREHWVAGAPALVHAETLYRRVRHVPA